MKNVNKRLEIYGIFFNRKNEDALINSDLRYRGAFEDRINCISNTDQLLQSINQSINQNNSHYDNANILKIDTCVNN
jgi:hypothetical protein